MKQLFTISLCSLGIALIPALAQDAKQDIKEAGHDTKQAAKKTGSAIKNGTKDAAHETAEGARKTGRATKHGVHKAARKIEQKTE